MFTLSKLSLAALTVSFALATTACGTQAVTASSALQPGSSVNGLGHNRPDSAQTASDTREPAERHISEHASALSHDHRGLSGNELCHRCQN
jgi:hypothetical protein